MIAYMNVCILQVRKTTEERQAMLKERAAKEALEPTKPQVRTRTSIACVTLSSYLSLVMHMQKPPTVKAESSNMHVTVESDAAKSIQVNKPIQYSAYGITHALVSNFLRRPIKQMVRMQ
jgi:hypothetical protein